MKLKNIIIYSVITLIIITLTSCISVHYPKRDQYMLNAKLPTKGARVSNKILAINSVRIAPQFSGFSFVYRTSDINYIKDYYNIFFNPPEQQIQQYIVNYLQARNLFKYVDDAGILHPDYILYSKVTALYADYRNREHPMGVMAIRFTLLKVSKSHIVLDKTIQARIPLQRKDTTSLVNAWNQGLEKILDRLGMNIKQIF
jgi:uncharacterized lipoprotein YmbA